MLRNVFFISALFVCLFKSSLQGLVTLENGKISISYNNCGTKTSFVVSTYIEKDVSIDNVWLGLGLNLNTEMDGANVVVCKKSPSTTSVEHYYNQGFSSSYMNPAEKFIGLSSLSIFSNSSYLTCKFTRDNSNPYSKYYNINKDKLYFMVAYGSMTNSEDIETIVNFPIEAICQEYTTLDNDKMVAYFKNDGTKTEFEVKAVIEKGVNLNNVWLAFGLNLKRDMPNTDVVMCMVNNSIQSVEHYYNDNLNPILMDNSNKYLGLSATSISFNGLTMTCKFTRENTNPNSKYYDLNKQHLYVLIAYGSISNGILQSHVTTGNVKETKNVVNFPVFYTNQAYSLTWYNYFDSLFFVFSTNVSNTNNFWSSFALSNDTKMGKDDVVVCKNYGVKSSIERYYNDGQYMSPTLLSVNNPSVGLSEMGVSAKNGQFTCSFARQNAMPTVVNYFNSSSYYFILNAYGPVDSTNGNLQKHTNRVSSTNSKNFAINKPAINSTSNNIIQQKSEYIKDDFSLSWTDSNDSTIFVFKTNVTGSSNIWSAFAFSTDQQMGNDDVCLCKIYGTSLVAERYYNQGKSSPTLLVQNTPSIGLSDITVSLNNNVLTCSFRRLKSMSSVTNYFDLKNQYYLLFAKGVIDNPGAIQHHNVRTFSELLIDFQFNSINSTTTPTSIKTISSTTISTTIKINQNGQYRSGDFNLIWSDSGNYTNITFETNVTESSNIWSAFAFSTDQQMGNDDVCLCKIYGTTLVAERYYNQGKSSPTLLVQNTPSIGLSDITVSLNNNVLTCSFRRLKSMSSVTNYFDLKNQYYLLFAKGVIDNPGVIKYHTVKSFSETLIDFQSNLIVTTTKYPISIVTQIKPQTPFISTGSFSSGSYNLKWSDSTYFTKFEFSAKTNNKKKRDVSMPGVSNQYLAFGFSKDLYMGDDNVCVCKVSNQIGTVEHYYNSGKVPGLLLQDYPTIGISNVSMKIENGQLVCSFVREKSMNNVPNYFDLSQSFFLLIAKGSVSSGSIQYHGNNIVKSDGPIDFKKNGSFTGSDNNAKIAKVKAHSCLMIIAWMFCVPTGILFARYYKFIFPSVKLLDVAFWFNAHRALMFLTPICSITAFIVILAALDWKWIETEDKLEFAHSIFGIVAIGLSIIQVIIAFFRPDPKAPKRPLFNFFHRTNGITCLICSMVAIFLAVQFESMQLGKIGWGIVLGWALWVFILPMLIEFFTVVLKLTKSAKYEVNDDDKIDEKIDDIKNNKKIEIMKQFFLVVHLIVGLGFTVALIVIIAIEKDEKTFA